MLPRLVIHDTVYSFPGHTEGVSNGLLCHVSCGVKFSDSSDLGLGKLREHISLPCWHKTISRSMFHVLILGAIFKITERIVGLVSIYMVDLKARWADKREHDNPMNQHAFCPTIATEGHKRIPRVLGYGLEDHPPVQPCCATIAKRNNPIKATNTSFVADLVQSFVSGYVLPTLEHGKNPFNRKTLRGVQGFLPEAGRHAGPFTLYSLSSLPARSDMNIVPLAERMFKYAAT